jgi:hypothetical protein
MVETQGPTVTGIALAFAIITVFVMLDSMFSRNSMLTML